MTKNDSRRYMLLALDESRQALPGCRPNPPVGCVLVKDGRMVAAGHTQPPGQAHAEALALQRYAGDFDGVAIFVTLEPCSFHGRTPPCAPALIDAGGREVYDSLVDPHPRNRGAGIRMLREAGANVELGIAETEVMTFLAPYLVKA